MQRTYSYLVRDEYSYYFRMRVPKDLQRIITRKELRYSLRTGNLSNAKTKARYLAGQFELLFNRIRKGYFDHMKFTKEDVNQLIKAHKDWLFEQYDRPIKFGQYDKEIPPEARLSRENEFQWTYSYKEWLHEAMSEGNYTEEAISDWNGNSISIEQIADKALTKQGVNPDEIQKHSDEYSALCYGLMRAELKGLEWYEKRLKGEYSDELENLLEGSSPKTSVPFSGPMPAEPGLRPPTPISKVIEERFEDYKRDHQKSSKKDLNRYKASIDMVADYFEDALIHTITRPMMSKYKKILFKIPARRNSFDKYKGKSIKQILAMNPQEKPLHPNTVSKHFYNAAKFLEYARLEGYISKNPAEGLKVKKIESEGHPFDEKELEKVFYSPDYREEKHRQPFQFWLPIMALFTGARLEELCSLRLKDFEQHGNIRFIDVVEDTEENKKLKNDVSRRRIPLHPFLTDDLCIMKRVEDLKRQKKKKFFPELKKNAEGRYSTQATGWFTNSFKKRLGIPNGVGKNFHSFRHTFTDNLKQQLVNLTIIDDLTGHKTPGESMKTYATKHKVKNLHNEGILKLDYNFLDLSHLKANKYAGK